MVLDQEPVAEVPGQVGPQAVELGVDPRQQLGIRSTPGHRGRNRGQQRDPQAVGRMGGVGTMVCGLRTQGQ